MQASVREFKGKLSRYLKRVAAGEEVTVTSHGRPIARVIQDDIYIGAPAAKVWKGIVDGEMTKYYVYGTRLESKLKKGAPYAYMGDGNFKVVDGEILEIEPEKRLVMSWKAHWDDSV